MKTESEKLGIVFFIFAILLSIYTRFSPTLTIGFPVTDGGLFYEMVKAIQANQYKLPAFVEYNGISIPFVYPPLGFYLSAFLSDLFNIPLIEIFRWLPAFGSVAFSIAIYPLVNSILKSSSKAIVATIFFILLPRSISWFIMGGGITRTLGQLFLLLTLFSSYNLFTNPSKKYLILTTLFGSAVILSHPEATFHTIGLVFTFWLFFGRNKTAIINSIAAIIGILILTSPVIFTNISRHGIQPYINASQTAYQSIFAWLAIFTGSFADEKFVTIISALALLGLMITWSKKDFLLTVMLFLPAILNPRSAASISVLAWSMLAAIGFADVVSYGLYRLQNKVDLSIQNPTWLDYFLSSFAVKLTTSALIFYSFFSVSLSNQVYIQVSLNSSERVALNWIERNIPEKSHFLILTGESEAFADSVSEWFPALTKSLSLGTIQGYEWQGGEIFKAKLDSYYELQSCLSKDINCLQVWSKKRNSPFEYVLIAKENANESFLTSSLSVSKNYQVIYQEEDVYIFKFIP